MPNLFTLVPLVINKLFMRSRYGIAIGDQASKRNPPKDELNAL